MKHKHPNARRRGVRTGRSDRGFMLIEALVALLIFAFGVLGIVGLQASMTKAQTQSRFRADAALLAQRLIGTMWSDQDTLVNYASAGCAAHPRCNEWATQVGAALPGGATNIAVAALPGGIVAATGKVVAADVTITITWTPPNEQQHNYTTTAAVAVNTP